MELIIKSLSFDNIINIVVTITLTYVLIRYFGPLAMEFFIEKVTGQKKRPEADFDNLIKRKEEMLRRGASGATNASQYKSNSQKYKSKTHELYNLAFKKYSSEGDNSLNYKKVLELFDNCEWGEGTLINEIGATVSSKLSRRLDITEITPYISNIIKREVLLNLSSEKLPGFEDVKAACESKVYLENLIKEVKNGGGLYLDKMKKLNKVSSKVLILAISYLIYRETKKASKDLLETFIKAHSPLEFINKINSVEMERGINKLIISGDNKKFRSISSLNKIIFDLSNLMNSLSPIPPLKNKKDLKGAFDIIQIDGIATKDKVKKSYQKLASIKHPDKLAAKGISKELEKVATSNFTIIQEAYDIILESLKE
ncbi:MAG: DnaJ domain-containing protein [Bacteriovoracaceae bacterium]|nr:DnaJ domain-containing protein [Bacteriovoracaceae bacterium]